MFQEALTVIATEGRDEFRKFKQDNGYTRPRSQDGGQPQGGRIDVPAELVEIVDPETGEITYQWRVPEMVFEGEPAWNFFWMALAKRYSFSVTTTRLERKKDE